MPAPRPTLRVTVAEVARLVGGTVIGDDQALLTGISSLTEARSGDISFLANPRYTPLLAECRATAVLVDRPHDVPAGLVQIQVRSPDLAFAQVVEAFGPQPPALAHGIHPSAVLGEGVRLGQDVSIGAHVVIGDRAVIGDGCRIHPQVCIGCEAVLGRQCVLHPLVSVREACQLGDRVILHSGAVIGADGFGYASVEGVHHKIPQVGIVVLGDDVEIGANTTIDRARFGRTVIGRGTKIDNLVQIAHNVEIGDHCIIVAQSGIAGSAKLGRHVTLAARSGISGHLQIGDQAVVTALSAVSKSVPPRTVVRGVPAQQVKIFEAQEVALRRLPRTQATIKELLARVAALEARLAEREPKS